MTINYSSIIDRIESSRDKLHEATIKVVKITSALTILVLAFFYPFVIGFWLGVFLFALYVEEEQFKFDDIAFGLLPLTHGLFAWFIKDVIKREGFPWLIPVFTVISFLFLAYGYFMILLPEYLTLKRDRQEETTEEHMKRIEEYHESKYWKNTTSHLSRYIVNCECEQAELYEQLKVFIPFILILKKIILKSL